MPSSLALFLGHHICLQKKNMSCNVHTQHCVLQNYLKTKWISRDERSSIDFILSLPHLKGTPGLVKGKSTGNTRID